MRNKIAIFLICTLLVSSTTSLALTPFCRDEQQIKHQFFETKQVLLSTSKGWMKTFEGNYSDIGRSVQQTSDGGYIILGSTRSYHPGDYDVLLIKTDSKGKLKTISIGSLWFEKLFQRFPFFEKILKQYYLQFG